MFYQIMPVHIERISMYHAVKRFIRIFFETLVAIIFITYFKPSVRFSVDNALKNTLVITCIIFMFRMYNKDIYDKTRTGLFINVGTCFI